MGVWSTSLYGNDLAYDVKDLYKDILLDNLDYQAAYKAIMEEFKECLNDEDEAYLVWFALADTQWKTGNLFPEVKEKALYWIEKGAGADDWDNIKERNKWLENLNKLKVQLLSPVPEKKLRKRPVYDHHPWNVGDVIAYQLNSEEAKENNLEGKYIVFQKIGDIKDHYDYRNRLFYGGSVLQFFDAFFDEIPTMEDILNLRILPYSRTDETFIDWRFRDKYKSLERSDFYINMNVMLDLNLNQLTKKKFYHYVGNCEVKYNYYIKEDPYALYTNWLEHSFIFYYDLWKNEEYVEVDNHRCRMSNPYYTYYHEKDGKDKYGTEIHIFHRGTKPSKHFLEEADLFNRKIVCED